MEKLDLAKKYKRYYTAKSVPEIIEIEPVRYLSIRGKGDPSGEDYLKDIQALYSIAYAIKFYHKARNSDYVVAKLEGLWWFDEEKFGSVTMSNAPTTVPRSEWEYRLMMRIPNFVADHDLDHAKKTVGEKNNGNPIDKVLFFEMHEGKVIQILHTGPFDQEPASLEKMLTVIREHGFLKNGIHHEIYLSDFNRTAPEKLKTILREPIR